MPLPLAQFAKFRVNFLNLLHSILDICILARDHKIHLIFMNAILLNECSDDIGNVTAYRFFSGDYQNMILQRKLTLAFQNLCCHPSLQLLLF